MILLIGEVIILLNVFTLVCKSTVNLFVLLLIFRIFSDEAIDLCLFRFRYSDQGTKLVEVIRTPIKLKPFVSDVSATIDLIDMGNEYPPTSSSTSQQYKQQISIIPIDESELIGETYDGKFSRDRGSLYDVSVHHTVYKDDLRIDKKIWSFEFDIPALDGTSVTAKFKGRLRKGTFTTILKGQGMWKYYPGGERGDLFVELTVK
jgi:hypothetical protein